MLKTGDVVYFSQSNNYIGSVRNQGDSLLLASNPAEWERFIIQFDGKSYAFKQQISGLYIGGQVQQGTSPRLVAVKKEWETFILEKKGQGLAIKTFLNTYIVRTDKGVICTNNFINNNEIWKIHFLDGRTVQFQQQQSLNHQQNIKSSVAKIPDLMAIPYPSPSDFPKNGDRCYFHRGGLFIGMTKDLNTNISLATNPLSHEKWIIEIVGLKYALKQQISGHYFGCDVRDNQSPRLAGGRLANQQFTLQRRGNGIAFKSVMNTYLTQDGLLLKWRKNPKNNSQQFQIFYDEQKLQNERYGLNLGNIFNFSNTNHSLPNYGELFTLFQKNKSISRDGNNIKLSEQNSQSFYFDANSNGKSAAIKHATSGLYIGGKIQNNTSPQLVSNRNDWGNGNISIKSRQNTYLSQQNNKIVWKSNCQIGKDIWKCTKKQ